jgi:hypothetical protein
MSDVFASLTEPWLVQLRMINDWLAGASRLGEPVPSQPAGSLGGLPLPGAVSAAQLNSMASGVAAHRRSIAALQVQLAVSDEQLAVLARILGPFAEWTRAWAGLEALVMNARRNPGPDG